MNRKINSKNTSPLLIALYCRLSLEDGKDNESMSISNKKLLLKDYAEKNGMFNCKSKDLSRLGRSYIESGSYMEVFFPKHNVRYIAITDNYDSVNKPRQEAGVDVTVITTEPENISFGSADFYIGIVEDMRSAEIRVILQEDVASHFAVIDGELVWHGGMNLLGKEDAWDNLIRIKSRQAAAELLEIALADKGCNAKTENQQLVE